MPLACSAADVCSFLSFQPRSKPVRGPAGLVRPHNREVGDGKRCKWAKTQKVRSAADGYTDRKKITETSKDAQTSSPAVSKEAYIVSKANRGPRTA